MTIQLTTRLRHLRLSALDAAGPRAAKPTPLRAPPSPRPAPRALRPKPIMSHPWHRATEQMMHRSMRRLGMITIQPPIEILTPSHP